MLRTMERPGERAGQTAGAEEGDEAAAHRCIAAARGRKLEMIGDGPVANNRTGPAWGRGGRGQAALGTRPISPDKTARQGKIVSLHSYLGADQGNAGGRLPRGHASHQRSWPLLFWCM